MSDLKKQSELEKQAFLPFKICFNCNEDTYAKNKEEQAKVCNDCKNFQAVIPLRVAKVELEKIQTESQREIIKTQEEEIRKLKEEFEKEKGLLKERDLCKSNLLIEKAQTIEKLEGQLADVQTILLPRLRREELEKVEDEATYTIYLTGTEYKQLRVVVEQKDGENK